MDVYAIYLRRSRADIEKEQLGEFKTLEKHEEELTALAKARGYVTDEPYKEIVSGEHIAEREQFQKLMQRVSAGEYAGILVHEVSRLGRGSALEYGWVFFVLQSSHTLIITPTKTFDPNDEDDARYLQMELFLSNMELTGIRSRLNSGMLSAARKGCFIKPTPAFGYDRIKIEDNWTLTPNEDAPIVKRIFERAAAGASHGTIAAELNRDGISTQSGGLYSASRIYTILQNPHYMGKIRYHYYIHDQVPTSDGFGLKPHFGTRDKDYILVDGLHEGIVSEEIWQAANAPRGNSTHTTRSKETKNPLAGLLVCANCGRSMLRFINTCKSNGNKIEHLRHPRFCDCHMRGARLSLVVDAVADALEEVANNIDLDAPTPETNTERKSIEAALAKEEKRIQKALDAYFADAITVEELKTRRAESEQRAEALRERLKELNKVQTPKETKTKFKQAIRCLKSDKVSAQKKNDALKTIVKHIEFDNHTEHINHPDIRLKIVLL